MYFKLTIWAIPENWRYFSDWRRNHGQKGPKVGQKGPILVIIGWFWQNYVKIHILGKGFHWRPQVGPWITKNRWKNSKNRSKTGQKQVKTRFWEKVLVSKVSILKEKSIYLKNRPKRGSWWGANVIFGGKNLTILMKMGVETWKKVPEKRRFSN